MGATIRDVARQAGVSIKTVSRVLNREGSVKADTRARVLQVMEELGYVANVFARRLAAGRAYTIGLVYHDASWHYLSQVLQNALDTARQAGYSLSLHPCAAGCPGDGKALLELVAQGSVDGFLFTPPADNSAALLDELQAANVPFVRLSPLDRQRPQPYVTGADYQGARDMAGYLLSLGHRRIGFIRGPQTQRAAADRFAGYLAALERAKIAPEPALAVQGDDHFESGLACARVLLAGEPRPTAILANNDEMAAGALAAAHQLGLAVPAGLSVAGFDDIPLASQVWPPLTTVCQPIAEVARLATTILLQLLAGQAAGPLQRELASTLVIRQSTGPGPGGDAGPLWGDSA